MKRLTKFFVITSHIGFLLMLLFTFEPLPKKPKPLLVKTVVQTPAKPQKQISAPKKAAPKPQKPASPPAAKKTPEKKQAAIADKKPATKKTTPPPPTPRANLSEAILKELEESLTKIEGQKEEPLPKLKKSPLTLQVDNLQESSSEIVLSYTEKLIDQLKATLSLPEYGSVKIELDLREDGSVDKLLVLQAQSKANKKYLEEHLSLLHFPSPAEGTSRFVLTFVNE